MAWFFALSLPGLVVVLIIAGVIQLVFFRHRRKGRPGAASIGFNLLDTALRPGREHLLKERESKRLLRKEEGEGAPPRHGVDLTNKIARISRTSSTGANGVNDKSNEESEREDKEGVPNLGENASDQHEQGSEIEDEDSRLPND